MEELLLILYVAQLKDGIVWMKRIAYGGGCRYSPWVLCVLCDLCGEGVHAVAQPSNELER